MRPVRPQRRLGVLATLVGVALGALALSVAPAAINPTGTAIGIPANGSSVNGAWSSVLDWPVIAIHAVVTPDSKVVTWGNGIAAPPYDGAKHYYDVWDPAAGTGASAHTRTENPHDKLFCSGQYLSPTTGEILVFGGTKYPDGSAQLSSFSPGSHQLTDLQNPMQYPRWYPTSTVLQDGRALIQGGTDIDFDGTPQITPELYDPSRPRAQRWKTLTGATSTQAYGEVDGKSRWYYPRTWVQPDGQVFVLSQDKMFYVDVDGNGGTGRLYEFRNWTHNRGVGSSAVMFAPGKILQVGGHEPGGAASKSAWIIDLKSGDPVVNPTGSMQYAREWHNATVLPDGRVLVTGGSSVINQAQGVAHNPEIWDPATGNWTTLGAASQFRLYHSTAILLPDGSILTAGGGEPGPANLTNAEIFYPPYLYGGNGTPATRPAWAAAPGEVPYDETFTGYMNSSSAVSRVTMVKTGSVTHSFDMEQRFIELDFTQSGNALSIESPANANVATPGHYMMFALNSAGVPSMAKMVRLAPDITQSNAPTPPAPGPPPAPPAPAPSAPAPPPPPASPGGGVAPPAYRPPKLAVAAKAPKIVRRGRQVTYRFIVANRGPGRATRVTLAARVPKTWRLKKANRRTAKLRKGRFIWRAGSIKVRKRKFVVARFIVPKRARGTVRVTTVAKGKNTRRALHRRTVRLRLPR